MNIHKRILPHKLHIAPVAQMVPRTHLGSRELDCMAIVGREIQSIVSEQLILNIRKDITRDQVRV